MAPAAADCIQAHLKDFSRSPSWYDKIITGDLGLSAEKSYWICWHRKRSTLEAFIQIADWKSLTMKSRAQGGGGSGCGCAAVTMCAHFLADAARGESEADPVRADRGTVVQNQFQ